MNTQQQEKNMTTATQRICTLVTDKKDPTSFRVEHIDDDGGCEITIFSGPDALERAIYFASAVEGPYYDGWNDPEGLGGL